MIVAVLILGVMVSLGALWLGWGRRSTWQEATGWNDLERVDRDRIRAGNAAFAALADAPRLWWLGHSSLLLEWGGVRIVFDPVLGRSVGVIPRLFEAGEWPGGASVDAIVLTHAHMDHFDPASMGQFRARRLILPRGTERFLEKAGLGPVPMTLAEEARPIQVGSMEVLPLVAVHGGWRYPWQRGLRALSYMVRLGERSLYVAGDTAWGSHFEAIGKRYRPDYAVMPIGAYSPAVVLRKRHLNPEEAVRAALKLGAGFVMPCHFGTYRLSFEPWKEPLQRFARATREHPLQVFLPIEDLMKSTEWHPGVDNREPQRNT